MDTPGGAPVFPPFPERRWLPRQETLRALGSLVDEEISFLGVVLAGLQIEAFEHLGQGYPNRRWVTLIPFDSHSQKDQTRGADTLRLLENSAPSACAATLLDFLTFLASNFPCSPEVEAWLAGEPLELLTNVLKPCHYIHLTKVHRHIFSMLLGHPPYVRQQVHNRRQAAVVINVVARDQGMIALFGGVLSQGARFFGYF